MPKRLTIAEAQETLPELVSSLNSDGGQCPPYISGDRELMEQFCDRVSDKQMREKRLA